MCGNWLIGPNPYYYDYDTYPEALRIAPKTDPRGFSLIAWWIHPSLQKGSKHFAGSRSSGDGGNGSGDIVVVDDDDDHSLTQQGARDEGAAVEEEGEAASAVVSAVGSFDSLEAMDAFDVDAPFGDGTPLPPAMSPMSRQESATGQKAEVRKVSDVVKDGSRYLCHAADFVPSDAKDLRALEKVGR